MFLFFLFPFAPENGLGFDISIRENQINQCSSPVIKYSKGKDRLGKVANPVRGQLNRENEYFPVPVRA